MPAAENTPRPRDHVCPWWFAYTFDNPLRWLIHRPSRILGGLVEPGQTVLDIGCGLGYFSVALARMVGERGRVIAVDLQPQMLKQARLRARLYGVESRIRFHQAQPDALGVDEPVDFALAFWMVHEAANQEGLLRQVKALLKPGARWLIVEPKIHTTASGFQETLATAQAVGLSVLATPRVNISRAVILGLEDL